MVGGGKKGKQENEKCQISRPDFQPERKKDPRPQDIYTLRERKEDGPKAKGPLIGIYRNRQIPKSRELKTMCVIS